MTNEVHELSKTNSLCSDRKADLLNYVKANDVEKIKHLVAAVDDDILNEVYDDPYYKPILYIACDDLADNTSPSTVETLIDLGADMHSIEEFTGNKEAIHFAVNGNNPDILGLVIRKIKKKNEDLNAIAQGNTALNLLVKSKKVDSENYQKCLDVLLKSGIDVNIPDRKNITPILWASRKGYKNVVSAILKCGRFVDIDRHYDSGKNARTLIEEKQLYNESLSSEIYDCNENNNNLAIRNIRERNEEEFLKLEEYNVNDQIEEGTLLQLVCQLNWFNSVERLLEKDADVWKVAPKNNKLPIEIAAEEGYYKIFKLLLNKYSELPHGLLTQLLKNITQISDEHSNYEDCVKTLLNERNDVQVNSYSDTKNTPLHYASGLTNPKIISKLLEKGASLANKNDFNCLPVEDIDPQTLEDHFDSCITIKDQPRHDKQSVIVTFNYKSLIPTQSEFVDLDATKNLLGNVEPVSETGVVHVMSKIPEMRHLLVHPLISSFIFIKWHRMRWFFRINLLLFLIFCVSLITYVFLSDDVNVQREYNALISILQIVLIVTYLTLILREAFQMVLSIQNYFCSLSNVLEVIMLGVCFYVIFYKSSETLYKQLSSIAMVLIAVEIMVILGQHPKMCTNIVMFRTVTLNFFLFLSWYSVLILAFVLCFYKLFNNNGSNAKSVNSTSSNEGDVEKDFFEEPGLTFIKTIVMLTGELDAGSLNFENVWNRMIFLLFVFMIPIILFNLLNGLAVSDTQMIKNDAEIMGYIERVNYIVYIEKIILGNVLMENVNWKKYIIPNWLVQQISLVPPYLPEKKMLIKLYHNGKIVQEDDSSHESCLSFWRDVCVDKRTVKRVKRLLYDRSNKSQETELIKELRETIKMQERIIEQLGIANNS